MRPAFHRKFPCFFLLFFFAISVVAAPGLSLEHSLSHVGKGYGASPAPASSADSFGDSFESDVHCDLCGALTSGRTAMTLGVDGLTDSVKAIHRVDNFESLLLTRSARYAPESQRAPPLS